MTRRSFAATLLLAGCGRKLATRYSGWLFLASAAEKALAVADLAEFRRVTSIPLGQVPGQVFRAGDRIFAAGAESGTLFEIDPGHFRVARKIDLPGRILAATSDPKGAVVVVVTDRPNAICLLDPVKLRITKQTPLPAGASAIDVNEEMALIAAAVGQEVLRFAMGTGKLLGATPAGGDTGPLRFRHDGQAILAGLPGAKQVVTIDTATGSLLARLPLPFGPGRFSFNADGGQMFITGTSDDTIAIVNCFQSEVDQTIVAGRTPSGMAVAANRNLLLVTNPASGDLTILSIETRRVEASVHVGGAPGEVLVTPDEEYALVVSRDSGDVAVIRLQTVLDHSVRTKPLFTVFAMGASPRSAVIVPREA